MGERGIGRGCSAAWGSGAVIGDIVELAVKFSP